MKTTHAALALLVACSSSGGDSVSKKADAVAATPDTTSEKADGPEDVASPPPGCASHAECSDETPFCAESGDCTAPPPGSALGWGTPPALTLVYTPKREYQGTDLDFHPVRDELWVTLREFPTDAPCEEFNATQAGCVELEGSVAIISGALGASPEGRVEKDLNAWHFMRRPTSIAFAEGDFFATCHEARTGNYEDDFADFMGPTLWTADPEIFAKDPGPGLNGSHMDMLHLTPYCMGITHIEANAYFAFNGQAGALDYYDFSADHGPGHEDHSDGVLRRYAAGELKRLPDVPSHLAVDPATRAVYVADTGNSRVVRIDVSNATAGDKLLAYEAMKESRTYEGAEVTEIVAAGVVDVPSGLALYQGALYVSDPSAGNIYAFALDGSPLASLETGLPSGALTGITIHEATGTLFYTEQLEGKVYRVDVR